MTQERLALEIRKAFDSTHIPSPGLEERVLASIQADRPSTRAASPAPKLAGAFAVLLTVVLIAILAAPAILTKLHLSSPGSTEAVEPPFYSLAAVGRGYIFVVQRGPLSKTGRAANTLIESRDGGRSWTEALDFGGVYAGMQVFGAAGFVWTIDMAACPTNPNGSSGCMPGYRLNLYRTLDGGSTWAAMPVPAFPVEDAYFLDASTGWLVSSSPQAGLGNETLYSTGDGGASWTLVGRLPNSAPMSYVYGAGNYRVTFSRQGGGSRRGWFVGATDLFTSVDGGHSWQPVEIPAPAVVAGWTVTPYQPAFTGQDGILPIAFRKPAGPDNATANRVYLYISHDGGVSWGDPRPAPPGFSPVGDILSVAILDTAHVWLTSLSLTGGDNVQEGPAVARTADGGLHWAVARPTPRILEMAFQDAAHGYGLDVTGETNVNGIVSTSDGGASWHRVNVPLFGG